MPTRKVAVIAIGGNSLILSKDAQTVQDQYRALCVTGKHIVSLVELGYQVVVTYGNGPQVGFLLWRRRRDAVVDFPQPDKPTSAATVPFGTVREISCKALIRPSYP